MRRFLIKSVAMIAAAAMSMSIAINATTNAYADDSSMSEIDRYLESLKGKYSGGDGTISNPYKISTVDDLMLMRRDMERNGSYGIDHITYFELANDIYFNDNYLDYKSFKTTAPKNQLDNPTTQNGEHYSFNWANLDGKGYTIYGLYGEDNSLFYNTNESTIKNLNISHFYMKNTPVFARGTFDSVYENINVKNGISEFKNRDMSDVWGDCNGGLVDSISATANTTGYYKNINVDMTMSADNGLRVGMITGSATNLEDCSVSGSLTYNVNKNKNGSYDFWVGGLAGQGLLDWKNCTNNAKITINSPADKNVFGEVGGIVGTLTDLSMSDTNKTINPSISACTNNGKIVINTKYDLATAKKQKGTRQNVYAGGIISRASNCRITDCVNNGNISAKYAYDIGGILATNDSKSMCEITNCLNTGKITATACSYVGGIAARMQGYVSHCENRGDITSTEKLVDKNTFFVGSDVAGIVATMNSNNGNSSIKYCKNTGHIVARDTALWMQSAGIVSSISYDNKTKYSWSITDCVNEGKIEGGWVGGIAAITTGNKSKKATVKNCVNTGVVLHNYEDDRVAGIAQWNHYVKFTNCYNLGQIKTAKKCKYGYKRAGLIAGALNDGAVVENCYTLDAKSSKWPVVGLTQGGGKAETIKRMSLAKLKKLSAVKSIKKNAGVIVYTIQ